MGALLSEPVDAKVVERARAPGWVVSSASMQGWRRTHEDATIFQPAVPAAKAEAAIFAVLDGHGGDRAATSGSGMLREELEKLLASGTLDGEEAHDEIMAAFVRVDKALRASMGPDDRSGSTAVAAIVTRPAPQEYVVHIANCGDSRAVVCSSAGLFSTEDHKPQRADETRRIRNAGGCVECGALGGPMRVDGTLAVSRALGDFHFKSPDQLPELCKVTCVPEVATIQCALGDWIFLACDGIFDVFSNEEIHMMVQRWGEAPSGKDPDGSLMLADLLEQCMARGSKDNCSAVVVQLREDPEALTLPERQLLQGSWRTAKPDVRTKYAQFFEAHGFVAEAAMVNSAASAADVAPEQEPTRPSMNIMRAFMAMKGVRAIQAAWRSKNSDSDPKGTFALGESGDSTGSGNPNSGPGDSSS